MTLEDPLWRTAPRRFWDWWTGELADIASFGRLSPAALPSGTKRIARDASGTWVVIFGAGAASEAVLDPAAETLDTAIARNRVRNVRISLGASDALVRRIEIPSAARHDCERLLLLDLERTTPFRPGDIYSGHAIDPVAPRAGFVTAVHAIVPRQTVDDAVTDVEANGVRVADIEYPHRHVGPIIIDRSGDDGVTASQPKAARRANIVLAALLATATAAAAGTLIGRHDVALATLNRTVADARTIAQAKRQALETANALSAQADAVAAMAQSRVSTVAILNAVAGLLPDTAWITDLAIVDDELAISGYAKPAAALIGAFESSELFSDATMTSAITRDANRDRERFSLRVRIARSPSDKRALQ